MALPEALAGVVASDRCCGCGACAGVAACGRLEMRLTPEGLWQPAVSECTNCGVCERVCPGIESPVPEMAAPLGEHLGTFVGYSADERERLRGSSGGLATRVLKALLESGQVEAVVAVRASEDGERLFEAAVLRTSEEIQAAAGSKYYPVEFSRPLQELRASGERFALVGVPCVITALRHGRRRLPWLQRQCVALIGLACGHLVSTHYTAFLAELSGVPADGLSGAEYRRKPGPRSAVDYVFAARGADGTEGRELPFVTGRAPVTLWTARIFTPGACFRCADLFAVDADLTLMDAWLPEYMADRAGTSLAVARSEVMRNLLETERTAGRLHLEPIAPEQVVRSQAGALASRRVAATLRSTGASEPLRLRWQRRRARLSNRLMAGRGQRRAIAIATIRAWMAAHRAWNSIWRLPRRVAGKLKRLVLGPGKVRS